MYKVIIKNEVGKTLVRYNTPQSIMIVDINNAKKEATIYPTKTPELLQEIKDNVRSIYKEFDPFSNTKIAEVKNARQIAQFFGWLMYNQWENKYTAATIGRYMGRKDHATVLHSAGVVSGYLGYDERVKKDCRRIALRLGILNRFNKYIERL